MIDCCCWIGAYPFRYTPHPDPEILVRVLEREGLEGAWVGHLPSAFWRDPTPGNAQLRTALLPYKGLLDPTPSVRPAWPGWERVLEEAATQRVPAVRAYPPQWGMGVHDPAMHRLVARCGELGLVLLLTVRFEDLRQRGVLDVAGDLQPAAVRAMARVSGSARIVVAGAGREFIEEVHWGLTPGERSRLFWDFAWVWGPPEDQLAHLFRTVGSDRFVFGTHWPLRLTQAPRANLDLLPRELAASPLADARAIVDDARRAASR
ncbi:MAG TPA: hypothetical protein VGD77_11375 [Gemmatimonadaceae bacterium]